MNSIHRIGSLCMVIISSTKMYIMRKSYGYSNKGESIPESIILRFDDDFNQLPSEQPGLIPDSVTDLTFGSNFNQPLESGYIPNSVTNLRFGDKFNQPLRLGHIPNSVTNLRFSDNFNQPLLQGHIPDSVIKLIFCGNFNQPSFGRTRTYS